MRIASITLVLLFLAAFVGLNSIFILDEREQAIVVQLGEPIRTETSAGLKFKMPFIQNVVRLDRRLISLDTNPQESLTKNKVRILVDSFARFKIVDPLEAYKAARTVSEITALLDRLMQSTIRQVLASVNTNDIISGERGALMRRISTLTNEEAKSFGVEVVDVRLKRVDLPPANSDAIFQRMRTEREQAAAKQRAEGQQTAITLRSEAQRQVSEILAFAQRDSEIKRGEADALAIKIFANAFGQDEEFFEFYRTMQAYRKSLGKNDTTLVLSPDSDFFKLFIRDSGK